MNILRLTRQSKWNFKAFDGYELFGSKGNFIGMEKLIFSCFSLCFGRNIDDLHIVGTYNLIFNVALMVQESIGYALCLDKLVNTSGDSVLCFRPLLPKLEVNLNVIWKKHQMFSQAADLFIENLQAAIQKSNSSG